MDNLLPDLHTVSEHSCICTFPESFLLVARGFVGGQLAALDPDTPRHRLFAAHCVLFLSRSIADGSATRLDCYACSFLVVHPSLSDGMSNCLRDAFAPLTKLRRLTRKLVRGAQHLLSALPGTLVSCFLQFLSPPLKHTSMSNIFSNDLVLFARLRNVSTFSLLCPLLVTHVSPRSLTCASKSASYYSATITTFDRSYAHVRYGYQLMADLGFIAF